MVFGRGSRLFYGSFWRITEKRYGAKTIAVSGICSPSETELVLND